MLTCGRINASARERLVNRLYLIVFALWVLLQAGPAAAYHFGYGASEDGFDGPTWVKISPNGDALLISTTLTAIDTVHINHEAVIYYDLKANAVRWVKGSCKEDWEQGRFSPDENLMAATIRYMSYVAYGGITGVDRKFKLVLLDKDGHETATVDESDNLLDLVAFVNANQIVYYKNISKDRMDKYYLYDISKKTIQLLTFKNPDGSIFDNKPIGHLETMDGNKITLSYSPEALKVVDLSDLIAKPFPALTSYHQGTLKGTDAKAARCMHIVFQIKSDFLFEGCPARDEAYAWSMYKYNQTDNTVTSLFDSPGELGQLANVDVARNSGTVAYVLNIPSGGESIFIRDGDYQTPRHVKINLGAYKDMLSCSGK